MKKNISRIIIVAGLLLLSSCKSQDKVGPIEQAESPFTPTPIVVPTCTPAEEPTQAVTPSPTVTLASITEIPEPTEEPVLKPTTSPAPTLNPSPTPTEAVTPTEEIMPTESAVSTPEASSALTATPVPTVAVPGPTEPASPVQTEIPTPTETPVPTATPLPTATPTPAINPELLVTNGWQKTTSFDEKYFIIFPERFRNSYLSKTEEELELKFTCPEDEAIEFYILYTMNYTLEEAVEEFSAAGGIIKERNLEEKRISYLLYKDGRMHRGVLLEEQYARELLGSTFGEEEFITGVMNVIFTCPNDRVEEYSAETYNFYIIKNGEEN